MNEKIKKALFWILDLSINIVIIFGLVLIIQKWLIAPFDVSGASMCDTLNNIENHCVRDYGEKIIINEALYLFNEPKRGDIIVFTTPDSNGKYFIKRVIGLPGETVEVKNGYVFVTPVGSDKHFVLEEPYLNDTNLGNTNTRFSDFSVFEVPENQYFVLGDNRRESTDSRSCFQSTADINCKENPEKAYVPKENIRGKAWIVWWPISNLRLIDKVEYSFESQAVSESLEEK